jgi:putative MATE family efflux protein
MLNKQTDLLNGGIYKPLLIFTIPIFLSNIFQMLYVTADMVIVGHYLGDKALASIGASAVILELLIGFAMGVGAGFGIVASRSYGANDEDLLKRTVAGSIVLGGGMIALISVVGSIFMMPLLRLLNTPDDIIDDAYAYISVLIAFAFVMFIYNLCAGLLRAVGNSLVPLLFLIFSSVLNIGLDYLFIVIFQTGLRGVAAASIVAQGVSAVLCLIYTFKKCPVLIPRGEHFRFDTGLYKELASQGFSMGLMMSIVTLGSVVLQRAINGLGYLVIAGHVAARRINFILLLPITSLMVALATFVSQNKGANQRKRILKAVRYCNITAIAWGAFATTATLLSATFLVRLLSGSSEAVVIENGALYLMINAPFYAILGMLVNFRLALQGIGMKTTPVVSSVIELIGKVTFAIFLVPALGYLGVIISEPAIWCAMLLYLAYAFYTNPYIKGKEK